MTKSETGQSTVSWAKNSNSDGTYEIRYSDPSDESYEVIITKDSGYLLEGLLPDTEYTVQVKYFGNNKFEHIFQIMRFYYKFWF